MESETRDGVWWEIRLRLRYVRPRVWITLAFLLAVVYYIACFNLDMIGRVVEHVFQRPIAWMAKTGRRCKAHVRFRAKWVVEMAKLSPFYWTYVRIRCRRKLTRMRESSADAAVTIFRYGPTATGLAFVAIFVPFLWSEERKAAESYKYYRR